MPHNPRYDFNDEAIPYGAALYARVVERGLSRGLTRYPSISARAARYMCSRHLGDYGDKRRME